MLCLSGYCKLFLFDGACLQLKELETKEFLLKAGIPNLKISICIY